MGRGAAAAVAAVTAALFLSSCSGSTGTSAAGTTDQQHNDRPAITGQPAGYNADDVAFATNMIPHHRQAVDLAALAPDRSSNPRLVALANQISAAQQPEIDVMKVFLVQWNENPDTNSGHVGHVGHGGTMVGMVDQATLTKLQSLDGAEFDTLWLQSMISHHQGAIEMAKAEIANGDNMDAKSLADNIVTTQQAEIGQMKQLLGG